MTTHVLHTEKDHHPADENRCITCEGGLALCKACGGAEASMPTDCPGSPMTGEQMDEVQAGHLDYVNGEWVHL